MTGGREWDGGSIALLPLSHLITPVANPHASYFEIGVGAATGAMNPFGEAVSSAAGLAGGGIAQLSGGDFCSGFVAGSIVGGLVGGGLDDYARGLGKFSRGLQGADDLLAVQNATAHALRYTAASAGLGIAGGAVGYGLGGTNGALLGAPLGSAIANFAVAWFTAGTPIVVDLDGNSRAVDELEVDDLVLARSEFDPAGPLELKRVEEKFV
jgi:hypothetical protein